MTLVGTGPFDTLTKLAGAHMAKAAKKKAFKATPSSKRRSRGDVVRSIAEGTELKPRQVKDVLEGLAALMAADLSKRGSGEFNLLGLVKLRTVNKPATPARKGRNPFTGEEMMFKAKPASRKVRARALRNLNAMI
jgi:nucleoid DNA-binding protein